MSEAVDEIKNELAQIKEEVEGLEPEEEEYEEDSELIDDVMDLKRRVGSIEKELKEVTGALKKTIMDVRTLISEMDNPFNFLRSIGVDKLVEKAMETAEEEFKKAKRESMKERMKKALNDEEKEDKAKNIVVTTPSNVKVSAPTPSQVQNTVPAPLTNIPSNNVANNGNRAYVHMGTLPRTTRNNVTQFEGHPQSLPYLPFGASFLLARDNITRLSNANYPQYPSHGNMHPYDIYRSFKANLFMDERIPLSRLFIVATYVLLRFGEDRADKILSQYVREGWVSREVANRVIEIIRLLSEHSESLQLQSALNAKSGVDVEDHILVITLLNMLNSNENSWLDLLLAITLLRIGLSPIIYKMMRNNWSLESKG